MSVVEKTETTPFDPVAVLTTEEAVQAYLNDAAQMGDEVGLAKARQDAAQARIRIAVRKRLLKIIRPDKRVDEINDTDRFAEDLGMNSLDAVELILDAEAEFDFEIPDQEADRLLTVKDLLLFVLARAPKDNLQP